ncbi:MAG TPA: hypothetical protein VG734_17000 [Lacunisphaera sp.]|nr:hypothetical protein [Lacunisphaera sp.]
MLTPALVAAIAIVCFAGAYGIQKRKRWAWYLGWVFMFFSAGAVGMPLSFAIFTADSWISILGACVGLVGAICLWTGWAIWWSRRQKDFGVNPMAEYPTRR